MREKISKHLKYLACLYVEGELSSREMKLFEKELEQSPELRSYVHELHSSLDIVSNLPLKKPTEAFLRGQRNLLRGRIEALKKEPIYATIFRKLEQVFHNIKIFFLVPGRPVLLAVTYILIGLIVGRFLFVPFSTSKTTDIQAISIERRLQDIMKNRRLAAKSIEILKNGTDQVTFQLKAEDEFSYTGGVEDALVRDLLYYLLLNDDNPGRRLRSIKLMSEISADNESKMVLVSALLSDQNPGVRLHAIRKLAKYPKDKIVTEACVKVLLEDDNSAVRIEALKILSQYPDKEFLPVFQVVARLDKNEFIRNEAARLLEQMEGVSELQSIGDEG